MSNTRRNTGLERTRSGPETAVPNVRLLNAHGTSQPGNWADAVLTSAPGAFETARAVPDQMPSV